MQPSSISRPAAPRPVAGVVPDATRSEPGGLTLPHALDAERRLIQFRGKQIALYLSMPQADSSNAHLTPLVLVHSINAASSAAEVRPIFEMYARLRPVVAVELLGFGSSDRSRIDYTPSLMSDCIGCTLQHLRRIGFKRPVDLMAVSLSCEIAALAALNETLAVRSLAFISPTGFESRRPEQYENGRTKDKLWLRWLLEAGPWSKPLFRLLTSKKSMRKFLERTWGSKQIDEELLAYNTLTVAQPGARHAPYAFIGGSLFTRGIVHVYALLKQPVWMIHGSRGEFARVDGLKRFTPQGPWTIEQVDAGAMPYFERPREFEQRYDAFLSHLKPD